MTIPTNRYAWRRAFLSEHGPMLPSGAPDPIGRLVLAAIESFMGDGPLTAFPSQKTICTITGLGESAVRRALNRLEDGGWISREKVTKRSGGFYYRYQGLIPASVASRIAPKSTTPTKASQPRRAPTILERDSSGASIASTFQVARALDVPAIAGSAEAELAAHMARQPSDKEPSWYFWWRKKEELKKQIEKPEPIADAA
jgi:hypothetical protein